MSEVERIYGVQFSRKDFSYKSCARKKLIFHNPSKLTIQSINKYTLSVLYPTTSIVAPGIYTLKTNVFIGNIPSKHAVLAVIDDNINKKRYLLNVIDGPNAEITVVYNAISEKNVTVEIRLYLVTMDMSRENISTTNNIYPTSIETKLYYDDDGHLNFFLPHCNKYYKVEIQQDYDDVDYEDDDDDDDTLRCSSTSEEEFSNDNKNRKKIHYITEIVPVKFKNL